MQSHKANPKQGRSFQNSLARLCFALLLLPCVSRAEPWAQHKDRLPALAHKLQENESAIRHLLEEKNHADDPAHIHEIMTSMVEKHKALEQASKEYEEERLHVRFKHPDLASVVERRYKHYKVKSIEEIGKGAGLEGRLDRLKAKVVSVFPFPEDEKKVGNQHGRVPASTAEIDELKFEPIILTK